MMKFTAYIIACAFTLLLAGNSHAGFLSALLDRNKAGADNQQRLVAGQQVPPPAEQANKPAAAPGQKAPDEKEIKAAARKIAKQMSWDAVPNDLFQRYAGKWQGTFWVYSLVGKKQQVNRVQINYEPQNDGTMKMTTLSFDMISKVWVTEETATYTIKGDTIIVEIKRPTGQTQKQTGHYSDGQLFFKGEIDDGAEHFRERISGKDLLVDGFGVYGSFKGADHHIFIGRFKREN
ncbi:MAG: lipocalin family protein [bacterium]|nr:lipocalin family protein [Candidatus Sumerlaeota bacterium]